MIVRVIKVLINIILANMKLLILNLLNPKSLKYHPFNFISFNCTVTLFSRGKIVLGKKVKINSHSTLSAIDGGLLKVGNNSFINNNCQIVSHKSITIGDDVMIGPNVVIVDHNHKYNNKGILKKEYKSDDIIIGNNVWIGANSVILKGTRIGNNSIVAAGSVIHGEYDEKSLIVQKRNTEIRKIEE